MQTFFFFFFLSLTAKYWSCYCFKFYFVLPGVRAWLSTRDQVRTRPLVPVLRKPAIQPTAACWEDELPPHQRPRSPTEPLSLGFQVLAGCLGLLVCLRETEFFGPYIQLEEGSPPKLQMFPPKDKQPLPLRPLCLLRSCGSSVFWVMARITLPSYLIPERTKLAREHLTLETSNMSKSSQDNKILRTNAHAFL